MITPLAAVARSWTDSVRSAPANGPVANSNRALGASPKRRPEESSRSPYGTCGNAQAPSGLTLADGSGFGAKLGIGLIQTVLGIVCLVERCLRQLCLWPLSSPLALLPPPSLVAPHQPWCTQKVSIHWNFLGQDSADCHQRARHRGSQQRRRWIQAAQRPTARHWSSAMGKILPNFRWQSLCSPFIYPILLQFCLLN